MFMCASTLATSLSESAASVKLHIVLIYCGKVYHSEIFETRSDRRSHRRPGDEVYEASGPAALEVPPPVKAGVERGLVNAEPARIGS